MGLTNDGTGATLANEAKNTTKVIGKDRTSKPRAVDETRLDGNLLLAFGID
jgi:hypothetical protein